MLKRKIFCGVIVAVLLTLLTCPALAATLRFGTVDGANTVNLRSEPSSKADVLTAYKKGTWLRITDEVGGYYRVKAPDGRNGYMVKNYVYISSAAMGTIGYVNDAGYLNLRKTASANAKILGQYDDGTPCILLTENNGWYHVSVDGKLGYFDADYIRTKYTTYSPNVATVNTDNGGALRMRKGPGADYDTIKSFNDGAYVMILQKGLDWWKVTADGKIGYMDSDFLYDGILRKGQEAGPGADDGDDYDDYDDYDKDDGSADTDLSGSYAYVANPGKNQKLNLRKEASTKSKSLGRYGNGVKVQLLSIGSPWCRVKVDGQVGYMMTQFLSVTKPDVDEPSNGGGMTSASGYAYVSNPRADQKLNLRKSASKDSKSLGRYGNGVRVELLETGAQWCKVRVDGKVGYMMTEFLNLKTTSGTPTVRVSHPDGTYVNLRNAASQKTGDVLVRVPDGAKVTVLTPGKTWSKVRYLGYTGYMMTRFLDD